MLICWIKLNADQSKVRNDACRTSRTGSDIRGRVTESDPSTSTHRYPNPDPLVFDYLTRFWFVLLSSAAPQWKILSTTSTFKPEFLNQVQTGPNWSSAAFTDCSGPFHKDSDGSVRLFWLLLDSFFQSYSDVPDIQMGSEGHIQQSKLVQFQNQQTGFLSFNLQLNFQTFTYVMQGHFQSVQAELCINIFSDGLSGVLSDSRTTQSS